jgi:hypothetical protein
MANEHRFNVTGPFPGGKLAKQEPVTAGYMTRPSQFIDPTPFPMMTEEIGYAPSPLAGGMTLGGAPSAPSQAPLGQIASKAIADVLGWKLKPGDSKGFIGALTQSFTLTDVEGHVNAKWRPRTYAVQSDLSGGITGAQASIYSRAKDFLDSSLPLLDGLYTLDVEADPGNVKALREVLRSQMTELVNELGVLGGPRVPRINQYFTQLLGLSSITSITTVISDPDNIGGSLGQFRDLLGLERSRDLVNRVEDEQNQTNYRLISDSLTSIAQTWINNFDSFRRSAAGTVSTPFFGTQLVLLSRQLSVISEAVDEVRFAMDSVFIGPSERQTLLLKFTDTALSPLFIEELLSWVQSFSMEEGPALIETAGKLGVGYGFLSSAQTLLEYVKGAASLSAASNPLPPGFFTARVQRSWRDLLAQLLELVSLARPVSRTI